MRKTIVNTGIRVIPALLILFFPVSCTFNYGESESSGDGIPNIVMENVDYVRVRSADPLARVQAERFERYDKRNLMKVKGVIFEQYGERGEDVNVYGKAGDATVYIDSGDIFMENHVSLKINTENITLETNQLEWIDGQRTISSGENDGVNIYKDDGTWFSGVGFKGSTRTRLWEFTRSINGIYVHED